MKTQHRVIHGDSRAMTEIDDASVDLIVTSPPYWQLKDYGSAEQIGFHDTYEQYINNLNLVWKECYRVLHDGCRLCVNIGDQFARAVYYGRYKVIPIREEIIKFCETIGFDYMGAVIWQKVTTSNTTGGGVQMGSYPYPRNGVLKLDYEFILLFKKLGDAPKPTKEQKELSKMTAEEWNTFFAGHWYFPGVRQSNHIAMYPEELPRRLIKMFSFVGETVLDPFLGSGTTALAAKNLHRNSVGYEINADFIPIIQKKLHTEEHDTNEVVYQFLDRRHEIDTIEQKIQQLPYIFRDPHVFDKKINIKKLQFGFIIDAKNTATREDFFTVKEILSPEKVRLNNGLIVKLLGIKAKSDTTDKAVAFLREKTQGKRVFLRYDTVKYDENDNLLCYLYLENKTFLNAHLLKHGLVSTDSAISFKYKEKFQALLNEFYGKTSN